MRDPIKISHETPICMLNESVMFNDYHYILFHLLDKYPKYKEFFLTNEYQMDSILDNSAYEFFVKGETLNIDTFAKSVEEMEPTYYILPDKLNDYLTTMKYIDEWDKKYFDLPGKRMGVVQGNSLSEFVSCYKEIKDRVDKIGISFGYRFLMDLVPDIIIKNRSYHYCMSLGRINLLNFMEMNKLIDYKKEHHLLGCYLPAEFEYHKHRFYIDSIDTAVPIKNGFMYNSLKGNWEDIKIEILFDEIIDKDISSEQKNFIISNIKKVRGLLNDEYI